MKMIARTTFARGGAKRIAAAFCLAVLAGAPEAQAQGIPGKIRIETNEAISHGASCVITAEITFIGQSILLSNTRRICGNANDRVTPVDQGWAFPANGSKTESFTCSIDGGHSPMKSCSNGERLQLVGMRFVGPVKLNVRQTLSSKLSASGVSLDYKASEQQTHTTQSGTEVVAMERNWKYDIRFENGGCRAVSVSKVETHNGVNRGPLSVRPFRCRVIG